MSSNQDNDKYYHLKLSLASLASAGFLILTLSHLKSSWEKYQSIIKDQKFKNLKHITLSGIIVHTHFDENQLPLDVQPDFKNQYNAMRYDDTKSILCLVPTIICGIIAYQLYENKYMKNGDEASSSPQAS